MSDQFARTELLLGKEAMEKLSHTRVAVFGIGGVGGYAAEALARSGVGSLELIDHDTVSLTNLNRQIIATHQTLGNYKVDVMKERILQINPRAEVSVRRCFYLPKTAEEFDFSRYSYVVDAVDTVTAKLEIIMRAKDSQVPVISCMGAGNKLDPAKFQVADIYQTAVCPLAKVMRRECKKRGIKKLKVVYSEEKPICPGKDADDVQKEEQDLSGTEGYGTKKRAVPGSIAFVPSVAGLILAGEVVRDLISC